MDQGKTGIRRAAWRLTSVPGCDGNGGMGSGEIAEAVSTDWACWKRGG